MPELFNDRPVDQDYPANGASFYTDPFGSRSEDLEAESNYDTSRNEESESVQDFSEYLGDSYPPEVYAELLSEEAQGE